MRLGEIQFQHTTYYKQYQTTYSQRVLLESLHVCDMIILIKTDLRQHPNPIVIEHCQLYTSS
jgi:hypothetical protein